MDASPLTQEQIQSFHDTGFLICADFLAAPQHAQLRTWVEEVAQWEDPERCSQYQELTPGGPVLARTERFLASHDGLHALFTSGKLNDAMRQLFAEPASVFKDKINYKHPGGSGFNPHQDAAAYGSFGSVHITCLVAVDPNTLDNGCLWFAPGQHQQNLISPNAVGCLSDELANSLEWVPATLEPGGVLFFSSFAPHKSEANHSSSSRRSLYVTYCKASEGDLRDAYYEDRSQRMRQQQAVDRDNRISTIGHFQGKAIE